MLTDYRLRQRDYLLEISRAMTARLDLESVLRLILQASIELVGAEAGLIVLRYDDDEFHVQASYGLPSRALDVLSPLFTDIPLPSPDDPLHWSIPGLSQRLALVSAAMGTVLRQVVALPMVVEDIFLGIIYLFRRTGVAFTLDDRRLLSAFADQAAIAVHNARLYQQVIREKRRLDAIIENSGDGIMILDADRRIQVFNRSLSAMTGIPADEAIGRFCHEVLSLKTEEGESVCETMCPLWETVPGQHLYVEGNFHRADGATLTLGITYSLLTDDQGRVLNIIANVRDITRFREAEDMKTTFISVISHELKTPVALIKGYAGTLRRKDVQWDPETLDEHLAVIEEESDRLNRLIDNLLDVSRLQAGVLKLDKGYVRMDRLAERVVETFRTQSQRHMFSLDFPSDFPVVPGDEQRLRQVLENLLSNAIKYSPDGGTIRVSGRVDKRYVYIAVTDEGIGIPESEQEQIFERFYRVENALSRRTQGAGLGLYLCRAIVEAHGGRIWVESKPGYGSTFVFTLPREELADDLGYPSASDE